MLKSKCKNYAVSMSKPNEGRVVRTIVAGRLAFEFA